MIRRLFQNTCAYRDPDATLVYIHCQMRANISPVIVRGVRLQRGQFLTTMEDFGNECGMNESRIRRVLKSLENEGLILRESPEKVTGKPTEKVTGKPTEKVTDKATKKGTVITVVNYGLPGNESEKSDGESDGQNDGESDGESDGETVNSIIIENKKPKKENREKGHGRSTEEGTQSKGVPPLASVHQGADQPGQSFVKNETAMQLAEEFIKRGFVYNGHGGGGFPAYLAHMMKIGYTERDFRKAFDRMCGASKQTKIRKHVGYFDTILAAMYESGECEKGFFLADTEKRTPIETSETVMDIMNYLIDHDIRFDRSGIRGMIEQFEGYSQNLDDGELWDIARTLVEEVNGDPDRIRNHSNYLAALADRLYPYN